MIDSGAIESCGKSTQCPADDELMERLLVDWPVAGGILARAAAYVASTLGPNHHCPNGPLETCRTHGLTAYASAATSEDRVRLLAFVDAVLETAAGLLAGAHPAIWTDAAAVERVAIMEALADHAVPDRVRPLLAVPRQERQNDAFTT